MSDTPETNAAVNASGGDWSPVLRAVAQRLERERDKAIRQLDNLNATAIHSCHNECQRPMCVLRRERDKALSVADTLSGIASAYLGWHLSRTPHGADDRSLEVARNVTAAIKRWKELKR